MAQLFGLVAREGKLDGEPPDLCVAQAACWRYLPLGICRPRYPWHDTHYFFLAFVPAPSRGAYRGLPSLLGRWLLRRLRANQRSAAAPHLPPADAATASALAAAALRGLAAGR